MSIHIKEPGIPNTTKLINSFARVYKYLVYNNFVIS
ncbi:hypothetical protein wTkk_000523 [Wolbachia endosymbiont of Trichogramma kaykai]